MQEEKINISEIMSIIPHRYPFLLIDRVIEIKLNESIVGIKNVTAIMPGVLIIEAMAQLSAVLVAKSMESTTDKEVFFMSIDESKFRKVVEPGDTLVIHAKIIQNRGAVWKFKARAEVDGKIASEGVFTAMVKDK
jgi:3-hydroxyacyl-[acyl-carrier-protein] dehydratase